MRYVRLISFNYKIEDLSTCAALSLDEPPRELHAVGTIADCHKEVVLSPTFSPNNFFTESIDSLFMAILDTLSTAFLNHLLFGSTFQIRWFLQPRSQKGKRHKASFDHPMNF